MLITNWVIYQWVTNVLNIIALISTLKVINNTRHMLSTNQSINQSSKQSINTLSLIPVFLEPPPYPGRHGDSAAVCICNIPSVSVYETKGISCQ